MSVHACCRCNDAAYTFVVNLIIPGTPVLSLVAVFINEHHPDILDGPSCSISHNAASSPAAAQQEQHSTLRRLSSSTSNLPDPKLATSSTGSAGVYGGSSAVYGTPAGGRAVSGEGSCGSTPNAAAAGAAALDRASHDDEDEPTYQRPHDVNDWQPFDFALHRFLHGSPQTRQAMFKLIPHIAEGSWVIKQSVGTVPVILGNKLQTVYYETDRYIEATVDVTSSSAAAYITSKCALHTCAACAPHHFA